LKQRDPIDSGYDIVDNVSSYLGREFARSVCSDVGVGWCPALGNNDHFVYLIPAFQFLGDSRVWFHEWQFGMGIVGKFSERWAVEETKTL